MELDKEIEEEKKEILELEKQVREEEEKSLKEKIKNIERKDKLRERILKNKNDMRRLDRELDKKRKNQKLEYIKDNILYLKKVKEKNYLDIKEKENRKETLLLDRKKDNIKFWKEMKKNLEGRKNIIKKNLAYIENKNEEKMDYCKEIEKRREKNVKKLRRIKEIERERKKEKERELEIEIENERQKEMDKERVHKEKQEIQKEYLIKITKNERKIKRQINEDNISNLIIY